MIYGIGTDIVNISRLEKGDEFLNRFIRRCLSETERQYMQRRAIFDLQSRIMYVAKRFAAKEAVAKALGTGFRDGIYLSDIEIISDELGKPFVELKGQALHRAKSVGVKHIHLSLSDDTPFVSAMAVAEK
jgi:holo-[acyl-carrier protein] synthase